MTRREFAKKSAMYLAAAGASQVAGFPSIITRSKRLLDKPSGAVCVNWGHPLAQGLSFLLPLNEGGGIDGNELRHEFLEATGGIQPSTNDPGNCSWVDGPDGKAIRFANINANIQLTGAGKAPLMPLDRITVLLIRRFTDSTLRSHTDFGFAIAAANTGHVGAICPSAAGNWIWRCGTLGGANAELIVAGVGKTQTIDRLAFVMGGRGMSIWRNGQLLGSQPEFEVRTANPSEIYYINRGLAASTGGDLQEVYFFAVYHEEWTPDQVSWWMAEPYGMLMPQSPTIRYFLMPGVGGQKIRVFVNT